MIYTLKVNVLQVKSIQEQINETLNTLKSLNQTCHPEEELFERKNE